MFEKLREATAHGNHYHFGRYGTFWHRFSLSRWSWAINLCKFEDHWAIHLFCLWIELWRPEIEPEEMMDSWGIQYSHEDRYFHLTWGDHHKFVHLPWSYDHCRTEVMLADGTFVPHERFPAKRPPGAPARGLYEVPEPPTRFVTVLPYRYTLRSGEVQEREATVKVGRRTWCWRSWPFKWWRWPADTVTSIEVSFSDEVGERTGSWKGGCIGCGYELLPNETPEQCLRRMERERVFD